MREQLFRITSTTVQAYLILDRFHKAGAMPTSRYEFRQVPRSPFQASFRVADDPPETENSGGGE
jgi:hypothetical protein